MEGKISVSTKIYMAYKVPLLRLNDFIDIVRPQIFNEAARLAGLLLLAVKGEVEEYFRFKKVIELFATVAKQDIRSPGTDIEFSLNIWLLDDYAYVIPFGEFVRSGRFKLQAPDWAKDYSYWNNMDSPSDISEEEWSERAKTWGIVNCGEGKSSHNARRLNHEIIGFDRNGDIGFEAEIELKNRLNLNN